jgi:two-component system, LytTR family, sensor kinase
MKIPLLIVFSWFVFCFIFLLFIKLLVSASFEDFYFHIDAPLWMFLECLITGGIVYFFKLKFGLLSANSNSLKRDFFILLTLIPIVSFLNTLFGTFFLETLIFGKGHTFYELLIEYLIQIISQTVVVLSCISYFYLTVLDEIKERLVNAQKAQAETRLKVLQQQVDPHFLFNNLSVLSSMISNNPQAANEFLDKLAELYRYILQTQNTEIISLNNELSFSQSYLYLIKNRFGTAYAFIWDAPATVSDGQMIIPTALQNLLENVVKHNSGNQKKPLKTWITLENNCLIVENEVCIKPQTSPASGTGLKNLTDRFAFFSDIPVKILQRERTFRVELPLLKIKK